MSMSISDDEEDRKMNESINKKYLDMYDTECIGGCKNMTNGSQFCCKTYCINDNYSSDTQDDEQQQKKKLKTDSKEIGNSRRINENVIIALNDAWNLIEKRTNNKRPANWDLINN